MAGKENKKASFIYKLTAFMIVIIVLQLFFILQYNRSFINSLVDYRSNILLPKLVVSSNTDLLLKEDFSSLQTNLDNIMRLFSKDLGIAYILIQDLDKNPVVQTFEEKVNADDVIKILNRASKEGEFKFKDEYSIKETKKRIVDIAFPLKVDEESLGTIRVGYFKDRLDSITASNTRFIILRSILVIIICSFLALYLNYNINSYIESSIDSERNNIIKFTKESVLKEFSAREKKIVEGTQEAISNQTLFTIIDSIDKILSINDYQKIIQEIVRAIIRIYGAREVTLFLYNNETDELIASAGYDRTGFVAQEDIGNIKIALGEGDTGRSVQLNAVIITDIPRPGYILSVPITAAGKIIGAFRATGKSDGSNYGPNDRLLSKILSSIFGQFLVKYLTK